MDYMLDERDVQTTALENADHGLGGTNGLLENLKLMVSGYAESKHSAFGHSEYSWVARSS
jgi:hypothetical protein